MEQKLDNLFQQIADTAPEPERVQIAAVKDGADAIVLAPELVGDDAAGHSSSVSIANIVRDLSIPGKIKLALLGNQTARTLLIRDANRLIPQFVLENPRLTENEVYEFARNKDLDDLVVRTIANRQEWMKNYAIKSAVICNPKTPLDVSLKWAKFLKEKELRLLSKSRNIPQALATQCRKLLDQRKS